MHKLKLTYTQIIALSFFSVILLGAFLLCLPISSRTGTWTPFINTMFTTTSATCVTGLVIYDTYNYWTVFGQLVILTLIQIGGIGLMTIISLFSIFLKKQISLNERLLLMQSAGSLKLSGIVKLIRRIAVGTIIFEGIGALILATRFCPKMGFVEGIYNAVFHSVSAFCNAGFDIMGKYGEFASLAPFADDIVVSLTISFLIIFGGLGFLVWNNIYVTRGNINKFDTHTKLVLTITGILLFSGTIIFLLLEYNNVLSGVSFGNKLLRSFFHSATMRTAGFSNYNIAESREPTLLYTIVYMFIGGSPGSTAGGIKTTTLAILLLSIGSSARRTPQITIFKKRLDPNIVHNASAVATVYLLSVLVGGILISAVQNFSIIKSIYEAVSAAGTVGLTAGITTSLNAFSKIIIMILMFGGRIGGLSMALIFKFKHNDVPVNRPLDEVLIG